MWTSKFAKGGIDADAVLDLLSKGGVVADVRTLPEYEAGHIPGARLVDPAEVHTDAWGAVFGDDPLVEPDATIVFVCDTGMRSSMAARAAKSQGHNAEFIGRGLAGWVKSGQYLLPGPPRGRR